MSTNRILLACLLLLGIIQVTGALKCFDCDYVHIGTKEEGNKKCLDGGDSEFEEECEDEEFCMKIVASGELKNGTKLHDYVSRGCASCMQEGVVEADGKYGKGTQHCCKGDLCNSATAALPGLTVLLASSLLSWLV